MSEAVLGLAQVVVGELGSIAANQIQSAWLAKTDLLKLERSLGIICPFIEDAEKRQSGSAAINQWLKELKPVVYDIDDLLDEASTDAQRLKLLKRSSKVELQPKLGGNMPMGLHNLETLYISGVPKLVGLPDGLESAASSLRYLYIQSCAGLTSLPLQVFKALEGLIIEGCPNLSLGCKEDITEDWSSYISNIPNVEIKGVNGHDDLFWKDRIRK